MATVRLSHIDYEKEQRGIPTERGNINRAIKAENQYREKANQMLELIDKAIQQEEARLQEERKKVAGQGKEMKGETANRHHHELEQPQRRPPELSYRERYLQRAEQHKLVRDQERSRSYRKPQQQTLDRYKKKSSLHDLFKEEIQKHHERQADERPIDKEQNQDPDRER